MRIHTVKNGDTIWKIARRYSTPAAKIIEANALAEPDRLFIGQKLMIFTPTRTYTVRGGDTLEKIAIRFGTDTNSLIAGNPSLMGGDKIYPTQLLAIRYDTPRYGMGCANAYYYRGCGEDKLRLALPYLSYVTIASHIYKNKRLSELFSCSGAKSIISEAGVIPIMRVFSPEGSDSMKKCADSFISELVKAALGDGFGGVCISAPSLSRDMEFYSVFMFTLKRALMEHNLFLFAELDGNGDFEATAKISDIADVSVLNYQKACLSEIPSFESGEKRILTRFAELGECQKVLIDINSSAYENGTEMELSEAFRLAEKSGAPIIYDEDTMLCRFTRKKYTGGRCHESTVIYEAPENEKAKLDLIGELGYMGVSFDLGRVLPSSLMCFYTSFSMGKNRFQQTEKLPPCNLE